MKKILLILSILFVIKSYSQITPITGIQGNNILININDLQIGGYLECSNDTCLRISGVRDTTLHFGMYLVKTESEIEYTPAIKLGYYNNTGGFYATKNYQVGIIGQEIFIKGGSTFATQLDAYNNTEKGELYFIFGSDIPHIKQ